MEQITTVGIDLAKNVFSLHGVDAAGKTVLRRTVRRDRLVETVAQLSPCLIGHGGLLGEAAEGLPQLARGAIDDLLEQLRRLDERIDAYDCQIGEQAKLSEPARRLMAIRGIGPTTAVAIVATVGNAREFKNGRQFAAWIGLVPTSTPPAASHAWGISASAAMRTFATCSCRGRARCSTVPLAARTGSPGGC